MKFGTDGTTTSAEVITHRATVSDFGSSSKGGPAKNLYTRFVLMWEERKRGKKRRRLLYLSFAERLGLGLKGLICTIDK
jgi:hypothetical protein